MKLSAHEIVNFYMRWRKGAFPHQRLGQAFVNEFLKEADPMDTGRLFYKSNNTDSLRYIWENHFEGEKDELR